MYLRYGCITGTGSAEVCAEFIGLMALNNTIIACKLLSVFSTPPIASLSDGVV